MDNEIALALIANLSRRGLLLAGDIEDIASTLDNDEAHDVRAAYICAIVPEPTPSLTVIHGGKMSG